MTHASLESGRILSESSRQPRRPIAALMLTMLAAKIAYDVVRRRWAATISPANPD